jgi:hypothetical protein
VSSCELLCLQYELQILLNEANARVSFYIGILFYDGVDPFSLNLKFNLNYLHCNRASSQFVLLMVLNVIFVSSCISFALQCICKERFVFLHCLGYVVFKCVMYISTFSLGNRCSGTFQSRKLKLVFSALRVFNEIFVAGKSASDWFQPFTYK